jgi:hypothetical protein
MEPLDCQDRFHEALQRAFAAPDPSVRTAYFELAAFCREKIGDRIQMSPSPQLLKRLVADSGARKDQ